MKGNTSPAWRGGFRDLLPPWQRPALVPCSARAMPFHWAPQRCGQRLPFSVFWAGSAVRLQAPVPSSPPGGPSVGLNPELGALRAARRRPDGRFPPTWTCHCRTAGQGDSGHSPQRMNGPTDRCTSEHGLLPRDKKGRRDDTQQSGDSPERSLRGQESRSQTAIGGTIPST